MDACHGHPVIAVNDAHRLAPWADVLYSSDQRWYGHYQGVPTFRGRKFGIRPLNPPDDWGITVLQNTGDRGVERSPTGLKNGRNSGAAAINLAVHLGAQRVVLVGYDMGHSGGPVHFFGEHPRNLRAESPYDVFIDMIGAMVAPLAALGVEVVNCSRVSRLDCFPRASLAEALA